jgi:hypothetical protein
MSNIKSSLHAAPTDAMFDSLLKCLESHCGVFLIMLGHLFSMGTLQSTQ